MSPGYPTFHLRRGDIYFIKVPFVDDPDKEEEHPVLVLKDDRDDVSGSLSTIVTYGTSNSNYGSNSFSLTVDPSKYSSIDLSRKTFFLANRIHTIDKKKYFDGKRYVGRLSKELMDEFDELLVLELQMGKYQIY